MSNETLDAFTRMDEKLEKIQKSLEAYLEKKRQQFPRFYFISSDDLLEILGQAKDLLNVQPHFKGMFEGVKKLEMHRPGRTAGGTTRPRSCTRRTARPLRRGGGDARPPGGVAEQGGGGDVPGVQDEPLRDAGAEQGHEEGKVGATVPGADDNLGGMRGVDRGVREGARGQGQSQDAVRMLKKNG